MNLILLAWLYIAGGYGTVAAARRLARYAVTHWRPACTCHAHAHARPAAGNPAPGQLLLCEPCGCVRYLTPAGAIPCPGHAAARDRRAWEKQMRDEMRRDPR